MTTTTLSHLAHVTLVGRRACPMHGLTQDASCARCGRETYDMGSVDERREVAQLRQLYKKSGVRWGIVGFFALGIVPDFVMGLCHGEIAVTLNLVPAVAGAVFGAMITRVQKPAAVRELDRLLAKNP